MVVPVSAFGYFVPIFAFFISFILASFFVVQASLVEFIEFSSAWVAVLVVGLFFILVILAFLPGKEPLVFLTASNWFSWVVLGLIIALFVISSAYVFNWALNWELIKTWFNSEIMGMVLLLIIAAIVSWKIAK
jgi:hypothetical protein